MDGLKQKVLSGLAWSGVAKLLAQLLSWVSTFVVIRYLNPDDYAVIGLALAFIGFFYVLSEFGLADALIQKKQVVEKNYSQVFTATLLLNVLIFIVCFLTSDGLSIFYKTPELSQVLIFVAANLLLTTFIVIPETVMNKEMDFKRRALIETLASTLNTLTTLGLAISGFGYWAILLGQAVNTITRVIFFNFFGYSNYKITSNFSNFRSLFDFGFFIFASRAVWALYNKIDILIIGRVFGSHILGLYTVAIQLASMPLDKVSGTVNQVAFSAFSQNKENNENKQHFLVSLRLLSVTLFPVFIGLAAVSPSLIPLFIGDKWLDSIPIIQLLSLIMPLKLISSFVNTFIASKGDAKFNLKMSLMYLLFISFGLFIGSFGSIIDTVIGLCIAYALCFILVTYLSLRKVNYSYTQFITCLSMPTFCSLLMWAIISLQQSLYQLNLPPTFNVGLIMLQGATVYFCGIFVFAKNHFREVKELFNLSKK